ncbi:transposase [Streptococcus pseudopneumoniae G42]|nr:transposase [Streptococcus pseudopneumoniae G42]
MKALLGIRKHLCVILVVQPQTQERHRDARQLYYKSQTKEGKSNREIASLLGKLLKLSTLKSSVGQSDNVLEKGASKRFILPTMLNSLMKTIAGARSRNQA